MEKVTMSKMFQILSMMAIIGVAGSSHPANAGNLPARGGKSDYPVSEPGCWKPYAGTVQNICSQEKAWWMPLISVGAGSFLVKVTAQAAGSSSNVRCISTGANQEGTSFTSSGWISLPQFGPASNIYLYTTIPFAGSGMVDCYVLPGGKLHTLNW
jgi:hypothetical protein